MLDEELGFKEIFTNFDNLKLSMELSERQHKPILIYFLNLSDTVSMSFTDSLLKDEQNLRTMRDDYISFSAFMDINKNLNPYEKIALGIDPDSIISREEYFASVKESVIPNNPNAPLILVSNKDQGVQVFSNHSFKPEELAEFLNKNSR